jgi:hypothetical protein
VKNPWLAKLRDLLFLSQPTVENDQATDRSVYERFAIPYTFKPQLSFWEALVATIAAFFRILLGSLLFAFWGTYTLVVWNRIHSLFWRPVVLLPLILVFVVMFTWLMVAITALARILCPKPKGRGSGPGAISRTGK